MALRLRRGTDAQRAATTPADGELIWTTDTQELYVGGVDESDVPIVGGIRITGSQNDSPDILTRDLDMDGNVLYGTGTINIQGNISTNATVTANAFIGDGSGIYNLRAANLDTTDLVVEGGAYNLNVIADDSTLILDATNQALSVTSVVTNTLTSNTITANEVVSNFVGTLSADDSTIMIDGLDKNAFLNDIHIDGQLFADNGLGFNGPTGVAFNISYLSDTEETNIVYRLDGGSSDYSIAGGPQQITRWTFGTTDTINGEINTAVWGVNNVRTFLVHDKDGVDGTSYDAAIYLNTANVSIGGVPTTETEKFLVVQDARFKDAVTFEGKITLPQINQGDVTPVIGNMYYDATSNQIKYVDDTTTQVVLATPYNQPYFDNTVVNRFFRMDTATRDGVVYGGAAVLGSVFFNTDTNQLELYKNNKWNGVVSQGDTFTGDLNGSVNLDDSTNIIAGDTGRINAPELVNFAQFTTGERDALTGVVGGSNINNTSKAKLQVYNGSTWVDLH